ncbi:MAG: hypothetical protein PWQ12_1371 [Clostridiales bacterium]|jgi:MOSC domain-containing protein YiiM|nr:hypothetical protein [Clostridiales bacterium]
MGKVIGRVRALYLCKKKGSPREVIQSGLFQEGFGLVGDAYAGKANRQVSLFSQEIIDEVEARGLNGFCTNRFSENITTEGIEWEKIPLHTKLRIGKSVQMVSQIGKNCHQGCPIKESGKPCIMPMGGAFTAVLSTGMIKVGDAIEIEEEGDGSIFEK